MKQRLQFANVKAPPQDRFLTSLKSTLDQVVQQNNVDASFGPALASAAAIKVSAQYHHVTGTAAIKTIQIPPGFRAGMLHLIPDAIFTTVTGGNIGLGSTAVVGKILTFVYDGSTFWPSY